MAGSVVSGYRHNVALVTVLRPPTSDVGRVGCHAAALPHADNTGLQVGYKLLVPLAKGLACVAGYSEGWKRIEGLIRLEAGDRAARGGRQ